MNTSNIFKAAHKLTKATIKAGDNYQATFAICLKVVYQMVANAISELEYRKLAVMPKTTKNGAEVLMIKVGSAADGFLTEGKAFVKTYGKNNNKLGEMVVVTGRGKVFVNMKDICNDYQYVYVTKI